MPPALPAPLGALPAAAPAVAELPATAFEPALLGLPVEPASVVPTAPPLALVPPWLVPPALLAPAVLAPVPPEALFVPACPLAPPELVPALPLAPPALVPPLPPGAVPSATNWKLRITTSTSLPSEGGLSKHHKLMPSGSACCGMFVLELLGA